MHGHGHGRRRGGRELVPHAAAVTGARDVATGEVVQEPPTFQGPAHLWTPPPYVDLTGGDDDDA